MWQRSDLNPFTSFQGLHQQCPSLFSPRVPGLGVAVLEGFVWLTDQTVPPALNTGKLHLHVKTLPDSSSSSWFVPTISTSRQSIHFPFA